MENEQKKNFILQVVFWLVAAGIVYVALKYAVPMLMPFIIGLLVTVLLRPLTAWLVKLTKLNPKLIATLTLILFYAVVGLLIVLLAAKMVTVVRDFAVDIQGFYRVTFEPALIQFFSDIERTLQELDPSLQPTLNTLEGNILESLAGLVTTFSGTALNWLTGFAGSLPGFFINFLFSIVASFFLVTDFTVIKAFCQRQMKPGHIEILRLIRENALSAMGKYVKAYLKLMCITFVILVLGLWLAGVNNVILIAAGIALFDLLPVLGVGGILIPWGILDLIIGYTARAVKLLLLYTVIAAVRNSLEARMIGVQIGLHPLLTLVCMYVGASLFGIVGMLGLPIAATILKNLNDKGTITLYKNLSS